MEPLVLTLVLAAAVMHAAWNAIIKVGDDRLLTIAAVMAVSALPGLAMIALAPMPAPASWPFLLASTALHGIYFGLLLQSYRFGDLSHAYPIARGMAPLLVALGAAVFAGETPNAWEVAGIGVVSAGIVSLAFTGGRSVRGRALAYPLATGALIAAYTVTDGIGIRLSGSTMGFSGWLFVISALPIGAVAVMRRRGLVVPFMRRAWWKVGIGGLLSFAAYALVLWALGLAPMAAVSALRETSVVVAAVIGSRLLGEAFGGRRVLAAGTVAAGVALINLAT